MKAPAPYFGGKALAAPEVWRRFGTGKDAPRHYIEPFAGMLGCLLNRPGWHPGVTWLETVSEINPLVANVWRAIRYDPEGTQWAATWPVSEIDLRSRHAALQRGSDALREALVDDPRYFDAEAAGWWIWGANLAIGKDWGQCSYSPGADIHPSQKHSKKERSARAIMPNISPGGAKAAGGNRDRGKRGAKAIKSELSARLDNVRVLCGDWSRVVKPSMFNHDGITAVSLDPPYAPTQRTKSSNLYSSEDANTVAEDVRDWCMLHGDDKRLRIALCGYGDEHIALEPP